MSNYVQEALNAVPFEIYKTVEKPQLPPPMSSSRVTNGKGARFEAWTINMSFLLRNTNYDFAITSKDQKFHDTVSLRAMKLHAENKKKNATASVAPLPMSKVPSPLSLAPSLPNENGGLLTYQRRLANMNINSTSRVSPADFSLSELGPKNDSSARIVKRGVSAPASLEGPKMMVPENSQFTKSHSAPPTLNVPREEPRAFITVMIKKTLDRRINSEVVLS